MDRGNCIAMQQQKGGFIMPKKEKGTLERFGQLTEKEQKIFMTFAQLIPRMNEKGKDYFLAFGEGMGIKADYIAKQGNADGRMLE